ncbi:MAG: calcium/sodium antiporter [Nitriliruptoraceae bacterium]
MLLSVVGIVAGLALLTAGADQFVVGSTRVAARLKVSTVVIGAVVIGFGTSAPELVVSALAGIQGSADLAVGNIVGSNIANMTLVLGVAAMITPVGVSWPILRREAPLSLGSVVLFAVVLRNGNLSLLDGALLLAALVAALWIVLRAARAAIPPDGERAGDPAGDAAVLPGAAELAELLPDEDRPSLPRESTRTLVGLLVTLGAAQLLVTSASDVARTLGLSEAFIGLTVVAIGTSLPELAAAVQAARRKETDLLIGNLLGSNLFNSGAVGAMAAFAGTGQTLGETITGFGALVMVVVVTVATGFMLSARKVVRWEAALLLIAYLGCLPLLAR